MLQAQIFMDRDELKGTQPLHEFIMQFLMRHHIAGATTFRGQMGFGNKQHLKQPNALFSFDETPVVITFIDEDEKVKKVLTSLREQVKSGFIVTNHVEEWQ